MDTKPAAKLVVLWLILVILLVSGSGMAPVSVLAQDGSPTQDTPLSPTKDAAQPAQADPATGYVDGQGPTAPAAALARYPGRAAYDSGWLAINAGQTLQLNHNLGGSVDNYVVDLRFFGASTTLESHGFNQIMYGGDQLIAPVPAGYAVDDQVGAYWHSLNTSSIKVYRMAQDKTYATKIRVRIWVITEEDYDSGWQRYCGKRPLSRSLLASAAEQRITTWFTWSSKTPGQLVLPFTSASMAASDQAGTNERGRRLLAIPDEHLDPGIPAGRGSLCEPGARAYLEPAQTHL